MANQQHFVEIEHKFLVGHGFDVGQFRQRAAALAPSGKTELTVADTYYLTALSPQLIYRHRYDAERQELTVKSRGGDTERRLEVNLRLDQAAGSQRATVEAFLAPLGLHWQGTLRKEILVYYFADCEVVYYEAYREGDAASPRLCCVEFEAVGQSELAAARQTLLHYEERFGFADKQRSQQSLFDLLLLPTMPTLG